MKLNRFNRNRQLLNRDRRGVAAVEFAFMAPILVTLVMGMIHLGRAFEMQNLLDTAAREGARYASMDRTGMVTPGQTANQKLISDVKNFLASNGISKDSVNVLVKDHVNSLSDFNLDDPANDLKLFDVTIKLNLSDNKSSSTNDAYALTGKVVFRNGRATISK